jgi:hypothetical protein
VFGLRDWVHIVDTTPEEVEKRVAPRAPTLELLKKGRSKTVLNVSETSPAREKPCRAKPSGDNLHGLTTAIPYPFDYRKVHHRATRIDSSRGAYSGRDKTQIK